MMHDDDDVEDVEECIYCGATVPAGMGPVPPVLTAGRLVQAGSVPPVDDDEAWAAEAGFHRGNCEWIATRAHRRAHRLDKVKSMTAGCLKEDK